MYKTKKAYIEYRLMRPSHSLRSIPVSNTIQHCIWIWQLAREYGAGLRSWACIESDSIKTSRVCLSYSSEFSIGIQLQARRLCWELLGSIQKVLLYHIEIKQASASICVDGTPTCLLLKLFGVCSCWKVGCTKYMRICTCKCGAYNQAVAI